MTTTTALAVELIADGQEPCIRVQQSDAGYYEIPPAAEVETVETLTGDIVYLRTLGPPTGWEPWSEVAEAINEDGEVCGLYFVARLMTTETKGQHTPGPWGIVTLAHGSLAVTDAVGAEHLAHVFPSDDGVALPMFANARLIVAAPETAAERDRLREQNAALLAAAEHLFACDFPEEVDFRCDGCEAARAAIAAARGGVK